MLAVLMSLSLIAMPSGSQAARTDNSWVRVKLSVGSLQSISLNLMGCYFLFGADECFWGGTLTVSMTDANTLVASHSQYGEIQTGTRIALIREYVDPAAGAVMFTNAASYVSGNSYLGHVYFDISGGYIRVINEVPLPQYLYGVIGHEMSESFPLEALKAQAVAAGSYAVTYVNSSDAYHFVDTSAKQVYKGFDPYDVKVIQAVDETVGLGQVLTHKTSGKLLRAFFCSSNGGETNTPELEWNGTVADTSAITETGYEVKLDNDDFNNPSCLSQGEQARYSITYGAPAAATAMDIAFSSLLLEKAQVQNSAVTAITSINSVSANTPIAGTTRAMTKCTVEMTTNVGNISVTFDIAQLKQAGVFGTLDHTLSIYWGEPVSNGYALYHARWGSGIGLSQRGAQARANAGASYTDILSFYYPQARIEYINLNMPLDPVSPYHVATPTVLATGVINSNGVNLRKGPSTYYELITTLASGTDVDIYGEIGAWDDVLVKVDGQLGFVHSTYVTITSRTDAPAYNPLDATGTDAIARGRIVNVSDSVNCRNEPSASSDRLCTIPKNAEVTIYGRSGSWYYVYYNGNYGYVIGRYVEIIETYLRVELDLNRDGLIDLLDVKLIADVVAGVYTLTDAQATACDLDFDGAITVHDALLLVKYLREA